MYRLVAVCVLCFVCVRCGILTDKHFFLVFEFAFKSHTDVILFNAFSFKSISNLYPNIGKINFNCVVASVRAIHPHILVTIRLFLVCRSYFF